MKKIASLIVFVLILSYAGLAYATVDNGGSYSGSAVSVSSDGTVSCGTSGKICNPTNATSISGLLTSILAIVQFVAGIVLVIYFILAGFKYVTARGDEGEIKKAHEMFKWTAVGGAILLGAEVIQKLISGTITQLGNGL